MTALPAACRLLRASRRLLTNNSLSISPDCIGALPVIQTCCYRTKWEKLRTHKKPTVPKFDYSGDNTLELPVKLNEEDTVFSRVGINTDQISEGERQLFQIHNADGNQQMQLLISKVKQKFGRDDADTASQELQIAMITIHIRKQIMHLQKFPKDKSTKRKLVEAIQLRTKMLKMLQKFDLKRFDWVINELELTYIPTTVYNRKIPIKSRIRQVAIQEMFRAKDTKLAALQESLAAERRDYYEKKSEIMQAVRDERDVLQKEEEELSKSCIETGYAGDNGEVAYRLAHIQPVDKEKWWRGHPKVIELFYGGKKPTYRGRVRKNQTVS